MASSVGHSDDEKPSIATGSKERFQVTIHGVPGSEAGSIDRKPHSSTSNDTKRDDLPSGTRFRDGQKVLFDSRMSLYDDGGNDATVQKLLGNLNNPTYKASENEEEETHEKANLGVILGVFMPCLQNIFGVIYFFRLYWIVGEAGWVEAFLIVFVCCCVSLITGLSISAIATNGRVTGGGMYFMISRSLGPEFGGAVGILFYMGISVSVAMYLNGTVELVNVYIFPEETKIFANKLNNIRLFGTILLAFISCCAFIGVRFVSKFAMVVLSVVLFAILSVFIGVFAGTPEGQNKTVCVLGSRLINRDMITVNGTMQCNKNANGPLHKLWCNSEGECDDIFKNGEAVLKKAIPGLSLDLLKTNAGSSYGKFESAIGTEMPNPVKGKKERGEIIRDLEENSAFVSLLAIYFPSITGFEQGTSYSGDLRDAQYSIPLGTIMAVVVTSIVYLSTVVFVGGSVYGLVLQDKFGESIGVELVASYLSWPDRWLLKIGALMSTVGAGLQALMAAPRLLQAIARDGVLPSLRPFAYMTRRGEPLLAIALSIVIAEIGILIANLDLVAPIVTQFFLICYCFINVACCLQSLLKTPHWRPRFRYYHWSLALVGVALCLALMLMCNYIYAIIALVLACFVYKYIEYKGAEKEWGDGLRGLQMSAARFALLRLKQDYFESHTKNWRPQLLVLMKLTVENVPDQQRLLSIASQLKAGQGLTIVGSIMHGDFQELHQDAKLAKFNITMAMEREQVKGFNTVVVSQSISEGISHVIQTAGLGALYPNTVVMCWPNHWFESANVATYRTFIDTLYQAQTANMAVQTIKGVDNFPGNEERLEGNIDIWWIMNDGSMLIMIAFLLKQHKTWRNCNLRIFTVAQMKDNSVKMKTDLQQYMYNLRIPASVEVVEMEDRDISAYIYERTLKMEERTKLLSDLNMKRKESMRVVDTFVDRAHHEGVDKIKPLRTEGISFDVKTASAHHTKRDSVHDETKLTVVSEGNQLSNVDSIDPVQYTFTPGESKGKKHLQDCFAGKSHGPEAASSSPEVRRRISIIDPSPKMPSAFEDDDSKLYEFTFYKKKESDGLNSPTSDNSSVCSDFGEKQTHMVSSSQRRNLRKMHTAVRLNEMLREKSTDTQLVILNMPTVPQSRPSQANYMNFLEVLAEGIDRVMMVRGTGKEVITIYS